MNQFNTFIEKFGQGSKIREVDTSKIEKLQPNALPEIITLLKEDGVSSYMNGFFWTLDPNEYLEFINEWLQADDICIPFARTALADLFFVHRGEIMILHSNKGFLDYTSPYVEWFFNRFLTDEPYLIEHFSYNLYQKLPNKESLSHDECFGFTPLLSLGGSENVENLSKVKMREYLDIVAKAADELTFYPY
ncbi:MAG: DUF1851 domain-containing protein [Flavobacteriaceae bacterium]